MKSNLTLTLSGVGFLILFTGGCYLWYQWSTEPYRQEYENTQLLFHEWTPPEQTPRTAHAVEHVDIQDDTPAQNKSIPAEQTPQQTDTAVEHINSQDATPHPHITQDVSPFGFGAYPKIPKSYPQDVKFFPAKTKAHELMLRVEIELINQGIDVIGSSMENGRVYPNVEGTVYVRWTDDPQFGRYISEVGGHPQTAMHFERVLEAFEEQADRNFVVSDAPNNIKIVNYEDSGIDPYAFLGL